MVYRVFALRVFVAWTLVLALACSGSLVALAQNAAQVAEVSVTGNQNISTDTIANVVSLKPGDEYTEAAASKDRAAIMALGYFGAVTVHKEEVAGGLKVVYEVTENPKITDVKVIGSEPVTPEQIKDLMKTKPGQVLNTTTINQDIGAIQTYYGDQGYLGYVTEDVDVDPQTGVLTIPIIVAVVESVEIIGNKKTRDYVFLREMKTRPGAVFSRKVLSQDLIAIYNLDILEEIKQPDIALGSEAGLVKVTIDVVERKTGQVSVGFGYSSRQRLVGQARLSETNFRGKGQGANILFEQGTSSAVGGRTSYELGFYEPWIDSRHTSLSVNAYDKVLYRFSSGVFGSSTFTDDTLYNERRKGGDLTLGRPIAEKTKVFVGGRFESVETDPSLLLGTGDLAGIVQDGDVTTGSLRLVHNTRDIDLDPASGGYESISLEFGSVDANRYRTDGEDALIPEPFKGSFTKAAFDVRRYFSRGGPKTAPQDKRTTLALRLRGGIGSGKIPFFEQFFVGGSESLRGYREDRFWGDKMLLVSAELRKPIAQSISGVIFADYGDAWGGSPDFFIGRLEQHTGFSGNLGVGVGMRVTTPIGHLRLDYGVGSEGGRTHFSMGHAF